MPIDQMLVTVTRVLEESVNGIQGLERVQSVTSRGSAEVDLFFGWDVDMNQTLERVNAALARVQQSLPPTAKLTAQRLTFAAFPIIGYSLTSATVPQTRLWELATYEMKPRLNRLNGVATVIVQGGQEPEFEIRLDPAKMLQTAVTVPAILDGLKRSNLIDSPGLLEKDQALVLSLVSGQARTPEEIADIVLKTTPAGLPVRIGDVAQVVNSVKPVYTIVRANGKPAVLLNVNRQPDGNTVEVANLVHQEIDAIRKELPRGIDLQPFYDQSEIVQASIVSVRDSDRFDSGFDHHGRVPARLGYVPRRGTGDSSHHRGHLHRAAGGGPDLQPDDAGRSCRCSGIGDRRRYRGGGKRSDAPRSGTEPGRGNPQRDSRGQQAVDRLDRHSHRGFSSPDRASSFARWP
jgi:multidrug efflux pump subunit AcrB